MTPQDIEVRLKVLFRDVPEDDAVGAQAFASAREVLVCHSEEASEADVSAAQAAVLGRWSAVSDLLPDEYGSREPTPPRAPSVEIHLSPEERTELSALFLSQEPESEPDKVAAIRRSLNELTRHIDEADPVAALTLYGEVMNVLVANIKAETRDERIHRDRARAILRYGYEVVGELTL